MIKRTQAVACIVLTILLVLLLAKPSYAAQPVILYQRLWHGSANDYAWALAADMQGSAYVAGDTGLSGNVDAVILKYNSTSDLQWQKIWGTKYYDSAGSVAVDSAGNLYVAGGSSGGGFILKLSSTGSLLWQKLLNAPYGMNVEKVAIDSQNNIYVAGFNSSLSTGDTPFLVRLNSSGNLTRQYTWGGNSTRAMGVAADSSGNIYVSGGTRTSGANRALLLKFDASGSLQWQRAWGGTRSDYGSRVTVDTGGNVYVTGYTSSYGAGGQDILLLKFNPSGTLQWQRTWGGNASDYGNDLSVDSSNHVWVVGDTASYGAGGPNVVLLDFDSSGNLLSQIVWGRASSDSVSLDVSGEVFVAGSVSEPAPSTVSSGNTTLGMPSFTAYDPNLKVRNSSFTMQSANGTLQSVTGSQSFAGYTDVFFLKLFQPNFTSLPSGLPLVTGLLLILPASRFSHRIVKHFIRYLWLISKRLDALICEG